MTEPNDELIGLLFLVNQENSQDLITIFLNHCEEKKYSPVAALMASRAILLAIIGEHPELMPLNAAMSATDAKNGRILI